MDTFGLDEDEFQEPDDSITLVFSFNLLSKQWYAKLFIPEFIVKFCCLISYFLFVNFEPCRGPFDRIGDISFRMNAHEDNVCQGHSLLFLLQLRAYFGFLYHVIVFIFYFVLFILSIVSHVVDLPLFLFSVQPNTALFEACCNEKIQQFDDSGSDEEVSANSRVVYHLLVMQL